MTPPKSLTDWGLAFAMRHDLELRPGNADELGPPRGFSLHVRGVPLGRVFQYDPESRPRKLVSWPPELDAALEPLQGLLHDREHGFLETSKEDAAYRLVRWSGTDRAVLERVLEEIIRGLRASQVPENSH